MRDVIDLDIDRVVEAAWRARELSYSPYSKFAVGAAVLTKRGRVYGGCNVENASYGLTTCAERVAIQCAVANGEREIAIIAVVAESDDFTTPCGACRQVLLEFCLKESLVGGETAETLVVMENRARKRSVVALKELLPYSFSFNMPTE